MTLNGFIAILWCFPPKALGFRANHVLLLAEARPHSLLSATKMLPKDSTDPIHRRVCEPVRDKTRAASISPLPISIFTYIYDYKISAISISIFLTAVRALWPTYTQDVEKFLTLFAFWRPRRRHIQYHQ